MAAPVRIEARAWSDIRFATLARLLGLADADHALIKVARLWSWQTEHYTPSNPTYAIDRDTIESVLGERGPEALVRARLADETPDGWRMRGTEGAIEWCADLSSKRQRAGQARAASAKRAHDGRMICNMDHSIPARAGRAGPAPTSTRPAQSSAPDPAPDPSPDQDPEKRESRVAPRPAMHRLDPMWVPAITEPNRKAAAEAKARGVDVEGELVKLHDWALAGAAKGADWDARWRNWLRQARAGQKPGVGFPRQQSALELQLEHVARLEAEEAEEAREKGGPS